MGEYSTSSFINNLKGSKNADGAALAASVIGEGHSIEREAGHRVDEKRAVCSPAFKGFCGVVVPARAVLVEGDVYVDDVPGMQRCVVRPVLGAQDVVGRGRENGKFA